MPRYVSLRLDDGFIDGAQKAAACLQPTSASFFVVTGLVCDMSLKNVLVAWLSIATLLCGFPDRSAAEPMNWPCPGRCFDAAWISDKGGAYFVQGEQFWRCDIVSNRVDHGEFAELG